eukprot:7633888-Heterocapsa_arctica.AAC.1
MGDDLRYRRSRTILVQKQRTLERTIVDMDLAIAARKEYTRIQEEGCPCEHGGCNLRLRKTGPWWRINGDGMWQSNWNPKAAEGGDRELGHWPPLSTHSWLEAGGEDERQEDGEGIDQESNKEEEDKEGRPGPFYYIATLAREVELEPLGLSIRVMAKC